MELEEGGKWQLNVLVQREVLRRCVLRALQSREAAGVRGSLGVLGNAGRNFQCGCTALAGAKAAAQGVRRWRLRGSQGGGEAAARRLARIASRERL